MKKIVRLALAVVYFVAAQTVMFGFVGNNNQVAYAQAECDAGFYPKNTSIVQNGNFAIAPSDISPSGDPGDSNINPGFFYSNASFYSQMLNVGTDVYPTASPTVNSFSVQTGGYDDGIGHLVQVVFPGDPTYNISGSNTWLYTNGNAHSGGEYLNWEQDVSGLTIGQDYVFTAYISNVIEPANPAVDDPIMRLKIGGSSGLPDGTTIIGPITLTEAATSNASALNGWQRVSFKFNASATTEKLKVVDASTGVIGDDFAMTAIGLQLCTPVPNYTIGVTHSSTPSVGTSFNETVTVNNIGLGEAESPTSITIALPTGYTVNGGSSGSVSLTNNVSGFSCTSNALSPQTLTCSSATPIPVSGSQSFQFSLAVGAAAGFSSVISADVSVPLEDVTSNNNDTDTLGVAPDVKNTLTVLSSTATSATVQTKVENVGTGHTTTPVTITQTLPIGLSVNSGGSGPVTLGGANAADWTCTSDAASPQIISCSHTPTMQNNASTDQYFTITYAIAAGAGQLTIQSDANTSNDTNSSNNQATLGVTSDTTSSPSSNLSNTGASTKTSVAVAVTSVALVALLAFATHKRYRKYSIR